MHLHFDASDRFAARPARGAETGLAQLPGAAMRFSPGEEIFGQGENAEYVYRIVSGVARSIHFSADGRRQILAFHFAGDVMGLGVGQTHDCAAEAVTACEMVLVRRAQIERLAGADIDTARTLWRLAAQQAQQARERTLTLGLKGAGERLAAFLLQMTERLGVSQELDLPMSRADIADYLALTIESVSRAFTQMERDQAIALPSARHVVLRNRAALERLEAA